MSLKVLFLSSPAEHHGEKKSLSYTEFWLLSNEVNPKKIHRRPKYFKTIKGTETPLDLTGRYRDIPQ